MLKKTLMIALLLAAAPTVGFAQDIRAQGDKACGRDATKLCKPVLGQGDGAVLSCFQENQKRLSKPCHAFLKAQGQLW